MILRVVRIGSEEDMHERFSIPLFHQFGTDCSVVAEVYRYLIRGRVRTKDDPQITIVLSDIATEPPAEVYTMNCKWPFDFGRYEMLTKAEGQDNRFERKKLILDGMQAAVLWMADQMSWEMQPFEEAYEEALERQLVLKAELKESWASPNKKFRCRIDFTFDCDGVVFEAALLKNRSKQEIARKHLATAKPYLACVSDYASQIQWIDETTLQMKSSNFAREAWSVDFSDDMKN